MSDNIITFPTKDGEGLESTTMTPIRCPECTSPLVLLMGLDGEYFAKLHGYCMECGNGTSVVKLQETVDKLFGEIEDE